jgi:diguanylate cyclase (GGDEF)-like protein
LFIDLDHFKTINDTLGHHVGDMLLSQVASRMSFMLRATDTLGRLGGDEFLFLAPELDSPDKLAVIAAKFIEILAQPIAVDAHMLHVTPSIGACCYPDHGTDRETLMRNADTAMYFAKSSGRNNFKFYTESLNADVDSRFQIENALRYALGHNELSLHYQPLMDVRGHSVFGVEALLRWNSKTLGPLSPAQFIPVAEDSGQIIPIGNWVLRQACMQVKQWRDGHGRDYMLAVNLSPQQFRQPDLVEVVATLLAETGFPPHALELEITESSLMHNISDVIATLHRLVALGVRLAIDDFGTGYSSLAYLRHFPLHKLKIDQSFVRDIGQDSRSLGIVTTIIALSATLGLDVIAEGVETPHQYDELVRQGCHFLQGYLFSKPLPVAEAELFLAKSPARGVAIVAQSP